MVHTHGRLVDVDAWLRWAGSPRGRSRRRRWGQRYRSLADWSTEELGSPRSSPRTDRMQADLVALAQEGDSDAALTLLVQLRPGLCRLVRWAAATGAVDHREAIEEVRAAFYETVCRHRLDRRPARIAANLVLDTRQRLHRAGTRARRSTATAADDLDRLRSSRLPPATDPVDGLAVLWAVRDALGQLPGSAPSRELTARAAYRAWILGQARSTIAGELGLGPAAVSTRLHRLRSTVRRSPLAA